MKTGLGKRIRWRATTAIALTAALALPLLLSGCDDHSPVAAPTSTLPAQDPSKSPPTADPQPTIPAYETDLDLTSEEKEAVEGALVAFEGFLVSINGAYSGNFEMLDDFPKYASGEALDSINSEANSIRTQEATFEGEIDPLSVKIYEVADAKKEETSLSVRVHFCVDTSQWAVTQSGDQPTRNPDGQVTMEHKILFAEGTWTVNKQALWERKC